jgi:hypothetical protein
MAGERVSELEENIYCTRYRLRFEVEVKIDDNIKIKGTYLII